MVESFEMSKGILSTMNYLSCNGFSVYFQYFLVGQFNCDKLDYVFIGKPYHNRIHDTSELRLELGRGQCVWIEMHSKFGNFINEKF